MFDVEFYIYGFYLLLKVIVLNNLKIGFLIKGWVVDVYKVMEDVCVCLFLLCFGVGIKGKLFEVMIM